MSSEEAWSIISSLSDFEDDQSVLESDLIDPSGSNNNNNYPEDETRNILSIATLKIPILKSSELTPTEEQDPYSTNVDVNVLTISEDLDHDSTSSDLPPPSSRSTNGTVQKAINFYEQLATDFLNSLLKFKPSDVVSNPEVDLKNVTGDTSLVNLSDFAATAIDWISTSLESTRVWMILILVASCVISLNELSSFGLWPYKAEPPVVKYWGAQTQEPASSYFSWNWNKAPVVYKKWYNSPADFQAAISQMVDETRKEPFFKDLESKSKQLFSKMNDLKIQEFTPIKFILDKSNEISHEIVTKASPTLKQAQKELKEQFNSAQSKFLKDFSVAQKSYLRISRKLAIQGTDLLSKASKNLQDLWEIWKQKTYPSLKRNFAVNFDRSVKKSTKWLTKALSYSNIQLSQLKKHTIVWSQLFNKDVKRKAEFLTKEYRRLQPLAIKNMQILYNKSDSHIRLGFSKGCNASASFYKLHYPFLANRLSEMLNSASNVSSTWMNLAMDKSTNFFLNVIFGATKVLDNSTNVLTSKLNNTSHEQNNKKSSKVARKMMEEKRAYRNKYQRNLQKKKARSHILGKSLCFTSLLV